MRNDFSCRQLSRYLLCRCHFFFFFFFFSFEAQALMHSKSQICYLRVLLDTAPVRRSRQKRKEKQQGKKKLKDQTTTLHGTAKSPSLSFFDPFPFMKRAHGIFRVSLSPISNMTWNQIYSSLLHETSHSSFPPNFKMCLLVLFFAFFPVG